MKQFESLSDTFDIEDTVKELTEVTEKKQEIAAVIRDQKYTLDDVEYMKAELQSLIASNRQVLDVLSNCCKVGAAPRFFEVYATLSNTVTTNVMELAKLEKIITDYQVTETKEEIATANMESKERLAQAKLENSSPTLIQNNTTNNLCVTSSELMAMIAKADEDAKINTDNISMEFDLS